MYLKKSQILYGQHTFVNRLMDYFYQFYFSKLKPLLLTITPGWTLLLHYSTRKNFQLT